MQAAGSLETLETDWADFGETVMVDDPGPPALLDPRAGCWDAAARLPSHDNEAHGALGQVRPAVRWLLGCDLRQPKRVGGRAAEDGHAGLVDEREPQLARHPPAGHHVCPNL